MIIKILSSAKNFAGIHYSERKNAQGKSELFKAENFGGLGHQTDVTKADYINYMKAICALNPRVKNKQFHAVVSVKGKDFPVDRLAEIGVQYLEAMGYGQNPYLIYHHSDTDNAHIHLVSTRVDKQGKKVDDAFEKIRSQKVLQEILMLDPKYEAKAHVTDALKYHFSTEAQLRLLLELQGFHLREKKVGEKLGERGYELIKYGRVQGTVGKALIDKRMGEFELPAPRAKQLRAILLKYSGGIPEDQLAALMKQKLGLDMVFHRKKGMENPYGYTVVDHVSKTVFKGSQMLRLGELLAAKKGEKSMLTGQVDLIHELVKKPGMSFHDLQGELAKLGYKLDDKGGLNSRFGKAQLSPKVLASLRYADRVQLASTFRTNDPSCQGVLSRLLFVDPKDIHLEDVPEKGFEAHKAVIGYLEQSQKWEEGLRHFDYRLLSNGRELFLLSTTDTSLIHLEKLMGKKLDLPMDMVQEIREELGEQQKPMLNYTSKESLLGLLLDVLAESQISASDNKKDKRKSLKR